MVMWVSYPLAFVKLNTCSYLILVKLHSSCLRRWAVVCVLMWIKLASSSVHAICCVYVVCFILNGAVGSTEYVRQCCTVHGRRKLNRATWQTSSVILNRILSRYQQPGLHPGAQRAPYLPTLAGSLAKGAPDFWCSRTLHLSCELD